MAISSINLEPANQNNFFHNSSIKTENLKYIFQEHSHENIYDRSAQEAQNLFNQYIQEAFENYKARTKQRIQTDPKKFLWSAVVNLNSGTTMEHLQTLTAEILEMERGHNYYAEQDNTQKQSKPSKKKRQIMSASSRRSKIKDRIMRYTIMKENLSQTYFDRIFQRIDNEIIAGLEAKFQALPQEQAVAIIVEPIKAFVEDQKNSFHQTQKTINELKGALKLEKEKNDELKQKSKKIQPRLRKSQKKHKT